MSKYPTGRKLIAALHYFGFAVIRVRGSHHYLRHPDGLCTVVPIHAGEEIGPGLLRKILKDVELGDSDIRERW